VLRNLHKLSVLFGSSVDSSIARHMEDESCNTSLSVNERDLHTCTFEMDYDFFPSKRKVDQDQSSKMLKCKYKFIQM
jgi:hypothetical protein